MNIGSRAAKVILSIIVASLAAYLLAVTGDGTVHQAASGFVTPFARTVTFVEHGIHRVTDGFFTARRRQATRIRRLEDRVHQLEFELARLRTAGQENAELRRQLALPPLRRWSPVTAAVIGRDPMSWNARFRVNRGTLHGVEVGNAVLLNQNVAGRVQSTTRTTALVSCIGSPSCRLSVRVRGTDANGIAAGTALRHWYEPPFCRVTYLPRDTQYHEGQVVETSGLGGDLPRGLRVGRVVSRAGSENPARIVRSAYADILVKPAANLRAFRYVTVLTRTEEAPPTPSTVLNRRLHKDNGS